MLAPSLVRPSALPHRGPPGRRLAPGRPRLFTALPAVALARVARPALLAERPLRLAQKRAVVWFRAGDLRATDHAGLAAAAQAEGMACCYVFELNELARLSPRRLALLQAAVEALKRELSKRGVQLQVAVAEDGAAAVSGMCRELGATEVYMHEDPVDLRVQGLRKLQQLCPEGCRVSTWRAPLRAGADALEDLECHEDYMTALKGLDWAEPVAWELKASVLTAWDQEVPSCEELRARILKSSFREQLLLREGLDYARGLGAEVAGEEEALRILKLYVAKGAEAVAEDIWGAPSEVLARSKEEWAFRRIAGGPDGWKGLRPAEVFSRALAEEMLWLGCISMRSCAQHLRAGDSEDCRLALEALEANEWHRLLALSDLSRGDVGYFRWRGYLCRYRAPKQVEEVLPPLLAVHGFAASCTQFEGLAKELEHRQQPMGVYALDLIGFGHAEKPPLSITQYVWEQCVKDFLLAVVGRPAILMGNSIGGYMAQSAAAFLGPDVCRGVVLLNSAGPLFTMKEYQTLLQSSGGTVLERMQKGYGEEAGLPQYSPPPQWLVDFGAWALMSGLQPNIEGILKSLYPSNPEPIKPLAAEILRDSKDPFASNVIGCFSRLGPNRPTNELLQEYAEEGGHLLVCQGMADQLGGGPDNQPRRVQGFVTAVPGLSAKAVEIEACGHCPHHEAPKAVADAVHAWASELL